jgi:hypothetical protein
MTREYAGAGTLQVTWSAPAVGTPDGYEIVGVGTVVRQSGTTKNWSGLVGDEDYTVDVRPYVLVGTTGSESRVYGPVATISTETAPGTPSAPSLTPGVSQITVTFTAPTDDGGQPITGYTVELDGSDSSVNTLTPSTVTPQVFTGLSSSVSYTAKVQATNSIGTGSFSSSSSSASPTAPTRSDNFNRADQTNLGTPSDGGSAWGMKGSGLNIVSNVAKGASSTNVAARIALTTETSATFDFNTPDFAAGGYAGFLLSGGGLVCASIDRTSSSSGQARIAPGYWAGGTTDPSAGYPGGIFVGTYTKVVETGFESVTVSWDGTTFSVTQGGNVHNFTPASIAGQTITHFVFVALNLSGSFVCSFDNLTTS